jgi:hypothetical protein
MQEVKMNSLLASETPNLLPISLRLVRLLISVLLAIIVATEPLISDSWKMAFSVLSLYTFLTGLFGKDPLFALFRTPSRPLLNQALGVIAQLECFFVGLVCIVAGVMYHNTDSLILRFLPFVGIYPILLCAVKHDLLGYLLGSYHRGMPTDKTG